MVTVPSHGLFRNFFLFYHVPNSNGNWSSGGETDSIEEGVVSWVEVSAGCASQLTPVGISWYHDDGCEAPPMKITGAWWILIVQPDDFFQSFHVFSMSFPSFSAFSVFWVCSAIYPQTELGIVCWSAQLWFQSWFLFQIFHQQVDAASIG